MELEDSVNENERKEEEAVRIQEDLRVSSEVRLCMIYTSCMRYTHKVTNKRLALQEKSTFI